MWAQDKGSSVASDTDSNMKWAKIKQGKRRVLPTMANIRLSAAQAAVDAQGKDLGGDCPRTGQVVAAQETVQ